VILISIVNVLVRIILNGSILVINNVKNAKYIWLRTVWQEMMEEWQWNKFTLMMKIYYKAKQSTSKFKILKTKPKE